MNFYQYGPVLWQSIPIYKDGKILNVSIGASADCSIETIALRSFGDGLVDLFVIDRHPFILRSFSTPETTPFPRKVQVFRPTSDSNPNPGHPPVYFKWIRTQILNEPVCTETQIDSELGNVSP